MSRVAPQSIVREGNPIQSAVVLIGDRMFTGRTHSEAFNRAIYEGAVRKEGGKFIYPKDAEVNSDLFMTKDGQIIDRLQASKMFDIGASETAIAEGLMQNKPPSSMSVDSYIEQATAIRKAKENPPSPKVLQDEGLLGQAKSASAFDVSRKDASDLFGAGAERVMYKDPKSGGTMEVLAKPDGTASVLSLEVPETARGKGIGQSLQAQVMQDYPEMMGQVSSKAAAKTAYRLGRRPPYMPDATLEDVYKMMDENSSVNLVSPEMQKRFGQRTNLLD
jgi:predicted GNAT family acetyltransferase